MALNLRSHNASDQEDKWTGRAITFHFLGGGVADQDPTGYKPLLADTILISST